MAEMLGAGFQGGRNGRFRSRWQAKDSKVVVKRFHCQVSWFFRRQRICVI